MQASSRGPVNFTALESRLVSAISSSLGSPCAVRSGSMTKSMRRPALASSQVLRRCRAQYRSGSTETTCMSERATREKLQHVVDQVAHPLGLRSHPRDVLLRAFVELPGVILGECQAPAVDAAQRRTQIVRYGIGEGFQEVPCWPFQAPLCAGERVAQGES